MNPGEVAVREFVTRLRLFVSLLVDPQVPVAIRTPSVQRIYSFSFAADG
jgi:hypothetical protein